MTAAHRSAALVALVLWTVFGSMAELALIPANAQAVDGDPWQIRRDQGWRDQIGGGVHGLAVDGDRMYAVVGGRLHVYDVADAARPRRLGRSMPHLARHHDNEENQSHPGESILQLVGNEVVLGYEGGLGILSFDVKQATAPRLTLRADDCRGQRNAYQLLVRGDDVLVPRGGSGSEAIICWFRAPTAAELTFRALTEFPPKSSNVHVAIRESDSSALAYDHFSSLAGRLLHWVTLDPEAPKHEPEATLVLDGEVYVASMSLQEDHAVILTARMDISANPVSLSVIDVRDPASGLAIHATLPISLTTIEQAPEPRFGPARANTEVETAGDHAFVPIVPDGNPRIGSFDLSDPSRPVLAGTAPLHGNAGELRVEGNHLFVSSQLDLATTHSDPPEAYAGVEIFDIADPHRPRSIGTIADAWNAVDVAAVGNIAVVAAAASGLRLVDVSDRDAAVEVGGLPSIGDVTAVKPLGGTRVAAAVASGDYQGIVVVDVADPMLPRVIGRVALPAHSELTDLTVLGDLALAVSFDGFVHIVDLADPLAPNHLASVDAAPPPEVSLPPLAPVRPNVFARAITAEDGIAYVGLTLGDVEAAWVVLVDVTDPTAPRLIRSVPILVDDPFRDPKVEIRALAIDAGRLAIATLAEVRLFSSPLGEMEPAGRLSPSIGAILAVTWRDGVMVVANQFGHDVADARDLALPRRTTSRNAFPLPLAPWRRHGGLAFLADGTILQAHGAQGLLIADPAELPVTPTPTDSPTATATHTESLPEPSPTIGPTLDPPPTSTPSGTPTPTATDALPTTTAPIATLASPTATATGDPSRIPPSSTATPTHRATGPSTVYLPLALAESCPPKDYFIDVVLVIDASTSMRERAPDGRRKLDVVLAAVRAFADGMRLAAGQDRAAIVAFNADATLVQSLTHNRGDIEAALDRVKVAEFSRVDLGVERAAAELLIRGRTGRGQAMVVLSDGLVNPVSSAVAIEAARRARQQGATLWIVGLGPSLDQVTLRAMASGPDRYQLAGDVLAVESIYHDLTRRVPCPVERYWAGR